MEEVTWVLPLLLLPGVSLLISSTSDRYHTIHQEIHHMVDHHESPSMMLATNLHRRARLFRDALLSLYLAVSAFAVGSGVGVALTMARTSYDQTVIVIFSAVGIVSVVYAALLLTRESMLSMSVIDRHFEMLEAFADENEVDEP